ncbi:SET domain-containing protein [Plenodomus tracheiphilus IPT5]|uniref:SET domain-containing protein n=1 Tax=Plenodomus tracheiphilus IPT5 TaxID=1408161 RepID=A0A6A7APT7_9PLEO|nr:SET domain-containing protein [Plenodomus tracheiphilus IPT5]
MADFQAVTDRFLAWFKSVGGEFCDDLLAIRDLRSRDAGRGIVAVKDIPEDTTLFTIPRNAIINVETSDLAKLLPGIFDGTPNDAADDEEDPLDPWASLILVMLREYLQAENSYWKPYIDILPTTFDTPIFWTKDELKELEGTVLTSDKIGKEESDEMLRARILPIVARNPTAFYPEGVTPMSEEDLLALAHRIGSTIMSYAFDLDDDKEESDHEEEGWVEDHDGLTMLGMVPMADVLNANADFNAHVNHGERLEVTSLRSDTGAGSEILNYYGPLPSSELLRRYGYVTPEHHRYDVAEISWTSVRTTLGKQLELSESVLQVLETQLGDDEVEDYFVFERDSGEPSDEGRLVQAPRPCDIPPELSEQLKSLLKALKKQKPDLIPNTARRDEILDDVITEVLTHKLSQYPNSEEEDEKLLKYGDLTKRHRMAIEVRLGEKRLLQEVKASLAKRKEARGSDVKDERPKKRMKTKA